MLETGLTQSYHRGGLVRFRHTLRKHWATDVLQGLRLEKTPTALTGFEELSGRLFRVSGGVSDCCATNPVGCATTPTQRRNRMKKLVTSLALLASATAQAGEDVCTKLMPDILTNYKVENLEVMRNGNPYVSKELVSCVYKATRPELYGDVPVMVTALLNTANNRFTVEIH